MRDFAESGAQISAESRTSEGSDGRLLDGAWITALLHSEALERPAAEPDSVQKNSGSGTFWNRTRREMPKIEGFEGEESTTWPQSFYCTFTARRRKCLMLNGAGEGNRTLVSMPTSFLSRFTGF